MSDEMWAVVGGAGFGSLIGEVLGVADAEEGARELAQSWKNDLPDAETEIWFMERVPDDD